MVLSAKLLDQNIEDQLNELQIIDEENKASRCRIELYKFSLANAYALKEPNFIPLFKNGNPLGSIMDISIAVSKNLVASVGADKYLRIWEYSMKKASPMITTTLSSDSLESNYKQLSCYFSKEVMNSVSIHPMGLQLAVGTREGIKVFYIIEDEIKLGLEIHGKMCLCVRYSNGGHYLAAGSGSSICIIDPYTFETQYVLIGHPSTVRFLKWSESDSHLLSNCNHGSNYGWCSNFDAYKNRSSMGDHFEPERIEFNVKYVTVHSIVYDEEYDICCYSTSDGKLTCMSTKNGCKIYIELLPNDNSEITNLCLAKNLQVLFAGTNKGSIRVYLWPIMCKVSSDLVPEFAEFNTHTSKVTNIEVSFDKRFVISSSEDGSIFFSKVRELCNGVDFNTNVSNIQNADPLKKRQYYQSQKCKVHLHMNSLSLVFKSALQTKAHQIQELKYYQEERSSPANQFADEINNINAKNAQEMESEKLKFKKLQEEHENERNFLLQTIESNLETHKKQLAQFNLDYETKLKSAYEQRDKLVDELENILEENKVALSHIEKEYKEKYEELQKNHVRLVNDMKRDSEKFYIALEQCEQEYERELQKKKEEFEEYMSILEKETEELKDTRDEYKREADKLEK